MFFYNPLDKFYKSVIGAISESEKVTFRVKGNFDSVLFVFKKDGEEVYNSFAMQKKDDFFEIDLSFSRGLYFYRFVTNKGHIGLDDKYLGVLNCDNFFQLTVYSSNYIVPDWLQGGVIYQIFPDRFCRAEQNKTISKDKFLHENWLDTPVYQPNEFGKVINNDFFGGDLKGITSKLNYLAKLGVTAIYLNPIFKAFSNHRYDTGNYMDIDPLLGTKNDFTDLILCANKVGIKIILDGVFNHTGDDSIYFNKYGNYNSIGAFQSKDSKYFNWFNFTSYPNEYESWWGITTLPSVNENCQDFIDYITGKDGVLEHYTKLGVYGWRLDVVDELPTHFVQKIRSAIKNINPNAIIIGEVWEDASNKISYGVRREYFQGYELDSVMNYPLKNAIINFIRTGNVDNLSLVIKEQLDHYPKSVINSLMNMLSTHDTIRLITAVAGEDLINNTKDVMNKTFIPKEFLPNAKFLVKVASLLQYTLYGVPSLYYGDEIGLQGYVDPLNRKCFPWGQEDVELLSWFEFLGNLRKNYDAFTNGELELICDKNERMIFARKGLKSEVLIAVNLSNTTSELIFDGSLYSLIDNKNHQNTYHLNPKTFNLFVKKD